MQLLTFNANRRQDTFVASASCDEVCEAITDLRPEGSVIVGIDDGYALQVALRDNHVFRLDLFEGAHGCVQHFVCLDLLSGRLRPLSRQDVLNAFFLFAEDPKAIRKEPSQLLWVKLPKPRLTTSMVFFRVHSGMRNAQGGSSRVALPVLRGRPRQ